MRRSLLGQAARTGWLLLLMLFLLPIHESAVVAEDSGLSLQQRLDSAFKGETIRIPPGRYQGSFVIRKPLRLEAEGEVVLVADSAKPPLTIQTNGAVVKGLQLETAFAETEDSALWMEGSGNEVSELNIRTSGTGVQLRNALENMLTGIGITRISGVNGGGEAQRGNGIDARESHGNFIRNCFVTNMFDGIYLENSDHNEVRESAVSMSRYGYHLMFSKGNRLVNNSGDRNVTGAMVMTSEDAVVTGNRWIKQSESVNSQGLLLYDVKGSRFAGNEVEGNRVGMYIELSDENELTDNVVRSNFIGIQIKHGSHNRIQENSFLSNVFQAEAQESSENQVSRNYWDAFKGLDTRGTGFSSIAFQVNPFYYTLTDETPAFQLFFQSPGLALLEQMMDSGLSEQSFTDTAPAMGPLHESVPVPLPGWGALVLSLLLAGGSFWIWIKMGVRSK